MAEGRLWEPYCADGCVVSIFALYPHKFRSVGKGPGSLSSLPALSVVVWKVKAMGLLLLKHLCPGLGGHLNLIFKCLNIYNVRRASQ